MRKIDFTGEASGLVVKEQRGRSQSRGSKKSTKTFSENFDRYYCKQSVHMKKTCSKYKEMLKKKGGPGIAGASTSGKQTNQASVAEEAVEEPCNVLSVNPGRGKGRFSDAWLLDAGCIYHVLKGVVQHI